MASLVQSLATPSDYRDRRYKVRCIVLFVFICFGIVYLMQHIHSEWQGTDEEYWRAVGDSTTLYVGNLSFFTTEEQLYELFSKCGDIKRIIMGLDAVQKTPCGFCFVE